ncbi:pilus assembly protein N-terminal domain-containing protein, partial [Desulfobotulus sp.]|uniref:pilus assembly protein N-terminal domain-containing protein n=1 Tax=Desulfobotulus sp. TaxID=1940337 RepID=UPI002A35B79E
MHLRNDSTKVTALILVMMFFLSMPCLAAPLAGTAMETENIELIAGKSLIMDLKGLDVTRISISSPEIADFIEFPRNGKPKQLYIKGNAPGVTNLILWHRDDLVAIYDVVVSYDVSRLKEKLFQVLPEEPDIQVFSANDTITLVGKISNNGNLSRALVMAESFAPKGKVNNLMEVGGTHQVMLEITVAEMSRSLGKELGIDASFFNESGDLGATVLSELGENTGFVGDSIISSAVTSFFRFSKGSATWTGFLNALQEDGMIKILSEPNLIAM